MSKRIEIKRLFILDEETKFLFPDKEGDALILSTDQLSKIEEHKATLEAVIILAELDWERKHLQDFYGYQVAQQILSAVELKSYFNLLFISTLLRETLYKIINNRNRVFAKSFRHEKIGSHFSLSKISLPPVSKRKFEYLRKYCLTESGILDKLEHDIRPGRKLSDDQIEDLLQHIRANADLLDGKMLEVLKDTNVSDFHQKRRGLHEQLISRMREVSGIKGQSKNGNSYKVESWKPRLLLLEDDTEQLFKMEGFLEPYFEVVTKSNGADAKEYLKNNAEQVSVAMCDMELLEANNLDQDVQGIDVLEYVKDNNPHIVLKVVSHLPKRALKVLFGDMLRVSDLVYKSMLLEGNPDFISDLVTEIQHEVDLRQTFQKLRGPSNTLWGNISRQGGRGGRLKQFYYGLKNDPDKKKEFDQMWSEIDEKLKNVMDKKGRINSHFPQVNKRNEIAEMPLQKSLAYLKELLINRMFWIRNLYGGVQEETVAFSDYKGYFESGFLLFSTDKKRFSQYGSLIGFSISKSSTGNGHKLKFNQFFDEELIRIKETTKNLSFDLANSFLLDTIYDLLVLISKAGGQAFDKRKYPKPQDFWDADVQMPFINSVLQQLIKETPSKDLRSHPESREKVLEELSILRTFDEFDTYPNDIKELISKSISNMDKFPEN
ncbi:MAG: response regulator [Chitinophagales bacterium]